MNKIDEIGRVLIPKKVREPLGWEKGNALEILTNAGEKSLTVTLANNNSENKYALDDLSRIQIPSEILKLLGWECRSTVKHIVNEADNSITMIIAA